MKRLVVIGAGVMGTRICRHFLNAGHPVALIDSSSEALDKSRISLESCATAPLLETSLENLPEEWRDADAVIEAVPEKLELKLHIIATLERFFSRTTIIASNTSGLRTLDMTVEMEAPERFIITHFFNPADLIPAVELVPGPQTSEQTVERTAALLSRSGKKVARLNADIPGFIANRLQHAMLRECFHLIETGVADAETIDLVTRYSLGVRLAMIGPLLQRDLNGLDTHLNIASYLYADLDARQTPPKVLEDKVQNGDLGRKAGRGFYEWDAALTARMEQLEQLLPDVISLAGKADNKQGE